MPYPVDETLIEVAEEQLGRRLPQELRNRLLRNNGGEIESEGDIWNLHPIWDASDRRRMKRTMSHIVYETQQARQWPGFPQDAIAIAEDNTGDRLILRHDQDGVEVWFHETGQTEAISVNWDYDIK